MAPTEVRIRFWTYLQGLIPALSLCLVQVWDSGTVIDFLLSKLDEALLEDSLPLNTPKTPLKYPSAFDLGLLADLQDIAKWSFVETRFSSFLYILFEPP